MYTKDHPRHHEIYSKCLMFFPESPVACLLNEFHVSHFRDYDKIIVDKNDYHHWKTESKEIFTYRIAFNQIMSRLAQDRLLDLKDYSKYYPPNRKQEDFNCLRRILGRGGKLQRKDAKVIAVKAMIKYYEYSRSEEIQSINKYYDTAIEAQHVFDDAEKTLARIERFKNVDEKKLSKEVEEYCKTEYAKILCAVSIAEEYQLDNLGTRVDLFDCDQHEPFIESEAFKKTRPKPDVGFLLVSGFHRSEAMEKVAKILYREFPSAFKNALIEPFYVTSALKPEDHKTREKYILESSLADLEKDLVRIQEKIEKLKVLEKIERFTWKNRSDIGGIVFNAFGGLGPAGDSLNGLFIISIEKIAQRRLAQIELPNVDPSLFSLALEFRKEKIRWALSQLRGISVLYGRSDEEFLKTRTFEGYVRSKSWWRPLGFEEFCPWQSPGREKCRLIM